MSAHHNCSESFQSQSEPGPDKGGTKALVPDLSETGLICSIWCKSILTSQSPIKYVFSNTVNAKDIKIEQACALSSRTIHRTL